MRMCLFLGALLLCGLCSSCGLVKMPFRVAGAVASHTYQAGKQVAKKIPRPKKADPKSETEKKSNDKPADGAAAAKPATPPPADGKLPEPPSDPNVPVPPVDLPEMPGDVLPLPPDQLPPL